MNGLANQARIGSKAAAPQILAQDDGRSRTALPVLRKKRAAEERLHFEKREKIARDYNGADDHRLATPRERELVEPLSCQVAESPALLAPILQIQVRSPSGRDSLLRSRLGKVDELRWIGVRQRFEQHGVDHAENGGIRANAERERQHRDGSKARILTQHADCIARVL